MKPPKVLRYDWADLTGLEELDPEDMESLRVMFRTIMANDSLALSVLYKFFNDNATNILLRPTSDTCVVLYRLLEQLPKETLNSTPAINIAQSNKSFSMGQFFDLVMESFFFSKRPVPIVSGNPPRILL